MIWTKDSAKDYLLSLPQEEIKTSTKIILEELDCSLALLKNFGIDGETFSALKFLHNLPSLPINGTKSKKSFIKKLNAAVKILRSNPAIWLNPCNLPHEVWRDVFNYETLYQASNYGRVKRFKDCQETILCGTINEKGYIRYCLSKNNSPKQFKIHRLVAQLFIPNSENKSTVNHNDGDKHNNCVWNLSWTTQRENVIHAFQIGLNRGRQGAENVQSKFTPEQVRWIREHYIPYHKKFGATALAKLFKVRETTIRNIVHFKTYKNVK